MRSLRSRFSLLLVGATFTIALLLAAAPAQAHGSSRDRYQRDHHRHHAPPRYVMHHGHRYRHAYRGHHRGGYYRHSRRGYDRGYDRGWWYEPRPRRCR